MHFVMLIAGDIVDIKEALKITGWRLCEFKVMVMMNVIAVKSPFEKALIFIMSALL